MVHGQRTGFRFPIKTVFKNEKNGRGRHYARLPADGSIAGNCDAQHRSVIDGVLHSEPPMLLLVQLWLHHHPTSTPRSPCRVDRPLARQPIPIDPMVMASIST